MTPDGVLVLEAPAKVNLYLAVLGRRPDGYHDLVTVLQTLDLHDTVTLRLSERDPAAGTAVRLTLSGASSDGEGAVPAGRDNLAVRAAQSLLSKLGSDPGLALDIDLVKRIPAGGGLGGGSSDAAAVLRGLHRLLDEPCDRATLREVAADLGSDVAFFLEGGTALCTGRGERVRPLAPPQPFEVSLLMPPFPIPTPAVYAALQAPLATQAPPIDVAGLCAALAGATVERLEELYRNDLEPAAQRVQPALCTWLDQQDIHLCGSGSTLFRFGSQDGGVRTHAAPLMQTANTSSRNH